MSPPYQTQAGNILIVDDVVDNLTMLKDMLEDLGHEVEMAMNGKAALQSVAKHVPDLILLDIQMPGMDGYKVCERLKADETTRDVPVIFISAHANIADVLRGFDVGGVDYVGKPFQFREVVARVQSQLALSQQRQEIQRLRERDRQQYEQLTQMKDRYISTTAHDLKNPLTGVLMYTQLLRGMKSETGEDLTDIAQGIEQSAQKMRRLITDIIDLAKMQVGEPLTLLPYHIQPILERIERQFRLQAQEKGITLTLSQPADPIKLNVHETQFERIFDNLISNALKYTPQGGTVEIIMEAHSDHVAIAVADSGLGIPDEDLPHVFEAFFRVKKATHKKLHGSGLGLSIVAATVEQHHGEITVESTLEAGSTFVVRLPHIEESA
jgi:two-component system, sensor histidine kinase and response regulator